MFTTQKKIVGSVQAVRLAHGRLEVSRLEVLPVLLQQGDEEVDRQRRVLAELVGLHVDVANADAEGERLLELELDCGADVVGLLGEVVAEGDRRRELVEAVHVRADDTGDGLDDRLRRQERVVAVAHLLNELLVLVEFLEVFHCHGVQLGCLGGVLVLQVRDHADAHARARHVREAQRAGETLVLVGDVAAEVELQVNRLDELTRLAVRLDAADALKQMLRGNLGHFFGVCVSMVLSV
jgi:hypothetical protein